MLYWKQVLDLVTYVSYVPIYVSSVPTYVSSIATYESSVATYVSYVATFDSYVMLRTSKNVGTGVQNYVYLFYFHNYDNFNGCTQLHKNFPSSTVFFLVMLKNRKKTTTKNTKISFQLLQHLVFFFSFITHLLLLLIWFSSSISNSLILFANLRITNLDRISTSSRSLHLKKLHAFS